MDFCDLGDFPRAGGDAPGRFFRASFAQARFPISGRFPAGNPGPGKLKKNHGSGNRVSGANSCFFGERERALYSTSSSVLAPTPPIEARSRARKSASAFLLRASDPVNSQGGELHLRGCTFSSFKKVQPLIITSVLGQASHRTHTHIQMAAPNPCARLTAPGFHTAAGTLDGS